MTGGTVVVSNLTFAVVTNTGVRNAAPGGNLTLTGCTFADGGTALVTQAGTTTLRNCTLFGNDVALQANANVSFNSCTVAGNTRSLRLQAGTVTTTNSIIAGNSNNIEVVGGTLANGGSNVLNGTATARGLQIDGNGQPVLADNGGPTRTIALALIANSPALDMGTTTLAVDQRGVARPQMNADDIGAFELQNTAPSISQVTLSPTTPRTFTTLTANVTASDPENNALTTTYVWRKNGKAINGETGSTLDLSKVGNGDKGDQISVTAIVSDGPLASSAVISDAVTILNTPPNPPNVTIDQSPVMTNDTITYTVTGVGSDADGDPVTLSYHWEKNGTVINGETGTSLDLSKPDNGNKGDTISIVVDISDGTESNSLRSSRVIANSPPKIASVTVTPIKPRVGDTLTADVVATDDDGETLTYSYLWKRNGIDLRSERNRTLSLSTARVGESYSVLVNAIDSTTARQLLSASVTVTANNPPTANDDSVTVAENSAATVIDVLGNDSIAPDTGETLTITAITQPTNGTATLTDGAVSYEPNANFDGSDSFTYTIDDGNGDTDTATVTITVTPVNNDPTANTDSVTVNEDSSATVIDVLTNDTFTPDTDETLTVTAVTQPANGSVTLSDGVVRFTPDANFNGTTSFTYTISDGNGGTATATVNVTVTAVNDAPQAYDDSYSTAFGTKLTVTAANGVLANDTDVENNALSVVDNDPATPGIDPVTAPQSGTLVLSADGSLTYTPNLLFTGSDTFTYKTGDGQSANSQSNIATVTIRVAANVLPVAVNDSGTTNEDTFVDIDVVKNDIDVEGGTLTVAPDSIADVKGGTAQLLADGKTVRFTPAADANDSNTSGGFGFTYKISDGTSTSQNSATATVNVSPVNDAPIVDRVTITPSAPFSTQTLTASVVASDVDNATSDLTYSYVWKKTSNGLTTTLPESASSLNLATAGNGDDGDSITVTVTANDGSADSAPKTSGAVTIGNISPVVDSVTPQGASNKVSDKRTFILTMSDGNGADDIAEMSLLINKKLDWDSGATLLYRPSATSPTEGQLFLRRGDAFLPPITIGTDASSTDVLDNGAVRIVATDVTITSSGNSITLTLPVTVRDGLVGNNTLFARVQDDAGALDAAALPGEFGYVRNGTYTVTPQFGGTNSAPTLSNLTASTFNTTLNNLSIAPTAQNFAFFVKDENGLGDIESVWLLAGPVRDWTRSATFIYYPRTRRLVLRSDDGQSFLGGGQIGTAGIIENSQVRVDLSKVKLNIYSDGKSLGLTLPLQAKSGLLGNNSVWLRVQDASGATSPDGDDLGFVRKGTWNVKASTTPPPTPPPSNASS